MAQLDQVFQHIPVGTLAVKDNGQLAVISPAFEPLTGLRAEDWVTAPISRLWAELLRRSAPGSASPQVPAPGERQVLELTVPQRRLVEVSSSAPGLTGLDRLLFFRDVTDELGLQQAKTRFLAHAAHEMRAPMGSIRGFTELLLLRDYPRADAREMLETVLRQALRLNTLLTDLLELSKIEAMGPAAVPLSPVVMSDVVERAVRAMRLPDDPREWRVDQTRPSPVVQGHAGKLEQVLINLLSNALKYSPAGAPIALEVEVSPVGHPDFCRIGVVDQGRGMTPEQLSRLFPHFYRADPNGPDAGTGLGLVIVKELVERMGGRIEVRSAVGAGSCFSLWLPLAAAARVEGPIGSPA